MKRNLMLLITFIALTVILGCASSPEPTPTQPVPADTAQEKLIWSSAPERPGWTMEEPDASDGYLWFVGISGRFATEQQAREDARRNALSTVVQYTGTLVKDKFERARTSYGLDSNVVDPTSAAREFEKQMSVNMANKVKVKNWYQEKWQTPTGVANVVFALAHVPQDSIDDTYKSTAQQLAKNAEQKAKEAGDELAKRQAEKAAEFFKQMQEQGVVE